MRAFGLAAVLIAAVVSLPSTVSQEPAPGAFRIDEDSAGDHTVHVAGQSTVPSRWTGTDILALDATESDGAYVWTLTVAGLGEEDVTLVDVIRYDVYFTVKGVNYDLLVSYDPATASALARLQRQEGDFGFYRTVEAVDVVLDEEAGTFAASIPHGLVLGPDGAGLLKGDTMEAFWVYAQAQGALLVEAETVGTVSAYDRMPDSGTSATRLEVLHGLDQAGSLAALSPAPVRVSNGEATTFLYTILLRNLAANSDVVELSAEGHPGNWVVTFPREEIRLDADAETEVPVLVTTPFFHEHGAFVAFNVTFQSRSDPLSFAVVELGVRYTKVPQPSGHHNTIFLHEGAGGFQYVNTLIEDEIPPEEDSGTRFSSGCSSSGGQVSGSSQLIPLIPDFDLGIDVDMDAVGLARLYLHAEQPVLGGTSVGGYIVAWKGDRPSACLSGIAEIAIAEIERSPPLQMDANSDQTLELEIRPLSLGDYIEHSSDISFGLVLAKFQEQGAIPICCLEVGDPVFVAGSEFRLPLAEYHDPVDEYFTSLSGVDITSLTEQQRFVNPGESVVFEVEVENLGTASASYDLELTGSKVEWAKVLGDLRITLDGGGVRQLAVAVHAPLDATDGDLADVTLHAVNKDDPNIRSLMRFLAEVDDDADHPDDADRAGQLDKELRSRGSPGFAPLLAVIALLAAAAIRRRA